MKKGDKVILRSINGSWAYGDPGGFYDGMEGEYVDFNSGKSSCSVKIQRNSHETIYHFHPGEIHLYDTCVKVTKPKTKSTFNISFGY
jgi:ribosomal protein L21E